ncbi:MAG: DHH family phosphoesterase, partial [Erysipelotrichia bacterium]|nr:DHH family phosphoesterase [Erysipelotrichia bacterium]
ATTVDKVMSTDLTAFKYDDYVDDVKAKINKSRYRSYPILDSHNHIIGTLSRYHVFKHANRDLILVDHNELSQSIDGAQQANILEIIDHHRIGGLVTASPVYFRNEQVGCTATIITKIFKENNMEIPSDLAGLLCCAIISDTVNFKSVTCTQQDKDIAQQLAQISGFNLTELGNKILAAGANLTNKSPAAIFRNDLKQFEINKFKVAVSQCNIVGFDSVKNIKDEMLEWLNEYSRDSSSDIVLMAFSMIDGSGSYILAVGKESHKLKDIFTKNGIECDGFVFLAKVISRKQQLVPLISTALE